MSAFSIVQFVIQHPDTSWEVITNDIFMSPGVSGGWGIPGNGPADRMATSGEIRFTMKDPDQIWIGRIGGSTTSTSWNIGTQFYWALYFQGVSYLKKRGAITEITPHAHSNGLSTVDVVVSDWIDYAARFPITIPTSAATQRSDQVVSAVLTLMDDYPSLYSLDTGLSTFPTIFDTTKSTATAYSEFTKAVKSELGYLYLKSDRLYGETLIFENFTHRSSLNALSSMPATDILLSEAGDAILDETGDYILADSYTTFAQTDTHADINHSYGKPIINRAVARAYPRTIDTVGEYASGRVLFKLGTPVSIGSAETKKIHGSYVDPDGGGARVNAVDGSMIAPVSGTDYWGNTNQDGSSGTDFTADLTVTPTYSSSGVDYEITNDSAYKGYVWVQARGFGVYTYNSIETSDESATSAAAFGWNEFSLNMPYQQDTIYGSVEVQRIVNNYKGPHKDIETVTYRANKSDDLMNAFLGLDIGDIIQVADTQTSVNARYYIQHIDFRMWDDLFLEYTWTLKRQRIINTGYTSIYLEGLGTAAGDGINFGYLPHINNLAQRSFSFWVWCDDTAHNYIMGGPFSDEAGAIIYISLNAEVAYYQKGATDAGLWTTANNVITTGGWRHVVVTRDSSTAANAPIIYVNGTSVTVTEDNPQGGATVSEDNCQMLLLNAKTVTLDWPYSFNGKLKDFRIYNRILTATEAFQIYDDYVITSGLVFRAACIFTEDIGTYEGTTLTAELKVMDDIYGAVGTPHGSPIAHTFS